MVHGYSAVEAVNACLEAIGQQPVSSATYAAAAAVGTWPAYTYDASITAQVKRVQERVLIDVLTKGWRFNTTAAKTYTALAGEVDLTTLENMLIVLRVIPAGANEYDAYEMCGNGKIINLKTGLTTGFSGDYQFKLVIAMPIEQCPVEIQQLIIDKTIRLLQETRMKDQDGRRNAIENEAKSDASAARPIVAPASKPINSSPVFPQVQGGGG